MARKPIASAVTSPDLNRQSLSSGEVVVGVHIDMSDAVRKLSKSFSYYSDELTRVALYNAINRACAPVLTEVKRAVSKQTSIPYGKVGKHILERKAHPNHLEYGLVSRASALPLIDFLVRGEPGGRPTVRVWGKTRTIRRAFILKGKFGMGIVKRTAKHHGGIKTLAANRKGPLGVKTLWGPIISKEMIRPGFASLKSIEAVPAKIQARLPHELEQAVARAKARAGT
jgi:hypothetical protein